MLQDKEKHYLRESGIFLMAEKVGEKTQQATLYIKNHMLANIWKITIKKNKELLTYEIHTKFHYIPKSWYHYI